MELALDAGADDVNAEGDAYEVLTPPAAFEPVKEALAGGASPSTVPNSRSSRRCTCR